MITYSKKEKLNKITYSCFRPFRVVCLFRVYIANAFQLESHALQVSLYPKLFKKQAESTKSTDFAEKLNTLFSFSLYFYDFNHNFQKSLKACPFVPSFLNSSLPLLLPSLLACFLACFLSSFLHPSLPPFLPSFLPFLLASFLNSFYYFLPLFFLLSFLFSSVSSLLPSILPPFLEFIPFFLLLFSFFLDTFPFLSVSLFSFC